MSSPAAQAAPPKPTPIRSNRGLRVGLTYTELDALDAAAEIEGRFPDQQGALAIREWLIQHSYLVPAPRPGPVVEATE